MELDFKTIEADLKIDETRLDEESLRTPQLHNKYLMLLLRLRNRKDRLERDLNALQKDKWLYYTGKMSEEEHKRLGWEPFELNVLRTDVDRIMDADKDILEVESKYRELCRVVDYIEDVVKVISNRQWSIRSAIDWQKFTNGQ
jgi:hypothetical protein